MQSGPRFKEYVIRTAPTAQKIQVARLIVPDAVAEPKDLSQWPKPVRLTREDTDVKEGNPIPVPVDKERFRALLSDDQHKGRARMRHMPLNLEDSSKELNFQARIGKSSEGEFLGLDKGGFEAPQTAHYFLFVLEGNEFKVYPSGDWFNFKPRIKYHTLSIEEAEEKLKTERGKGVDRWVMRKAKADEDAKEEGGKDAIDDDKFSVFGQMGSDKEEEEEDVDGEDNGKSKKKKKKDSTAREERDFDYQEAFDDDEGMDEGEEHLFAKEKKKKIDSAGQQMKSLLKTLEGDSVAGEDEESESEEEEGADKEGKGEKAAAPAVPGPAIVVPSKPVKKEPTEAAEPTSLKKEQEEAAQQQAQDTTTTTGPAVPGSKRKQAETTTTTTAGGQPAAKKVKTEKAAKATTVGSSEKSLEDQVKQLLLRKGKMQTIKLVNRFKVQVQGADKKAEFMKIVKNVANIMEIPAGSGKKYLVLKDKYKNAAAARSNTNNK